MTPTASLAPAPAPAPSHSAKATLDEETTDEETTDGNTSDNTESDEIGQTSQSTIDDAAQPGQVTCDGTAGPDSTEGSTPRGYPTPTGSATSSLAELPSDVLDLTSWYLTLPTGANGDPDTVLQPDLARYTSPYFQLDDAKDGVVFTADVDGVTTQNSKYPRTELREMNGQEKAAWSNMSGVHTLKVTEAVTELPAVKPETVTAQIHDGDDDVMQIRLEGSHLMVQYSDGDKEVTLDPKYKLGTVYEVAIEAADGRVQVSYNGVKKADLPLTGSNWYFKAGAYVQSNTSKGDAATAIGQVVVYSLDVTHRQ